MRETGSRCVLGWPAYPWSAFQALVLWLWLSAHSFALALVALVLVDLAFLLGLDGKCSERFRLFLHLVPFPQRGISLLSCLSLPGAGAGPLFHLLWANKSK